MAANDSVLADEDGEFSDWIEIQNPQGVPISLAGYHLTDNAANPGKWTLPALTLDAGGYLILFASGKNRTDPAGASTRISSSRPRASTSRWWRRTA